MDIVEKLSTVKNMLDIMKNFDEDLEVYVQYADDDDTGYVSVRSTASPVRDYSLTVKHFITFLLKHDLSSHVGISTNNNGEYMGITVYGDSN